MGAFRYEALDAGGRATRGVLQADTARGARAQLRDRGLNPLAVEAVIERAAAGAAPVIETLASRWQARRHALDGPRLQLIARELATLVGAGLPLDEALSALTEGNDDVRSRTVVLQLRSRVMEGRSLAGAMAEFPASFPEAFRAAIAAGESGGRLGEALEWLAAQAEDRDALKRQIFSALAYPLLLALVALAVVSGLMVYVVPKIVGVFDTLGEQLPWLTRALLWVSSFIGSYGLWLLLGLFALAIGAAIALVRPAVRERLDALWLRLPLLGRLLRAANTARAARTLATLVRSGVPVLEAIGLAAGTVRNLPMQRALKRSAARVREGSGFARALAESGLYPPVSLRLIASGERSGRLEQMLDEAARHQQREVDGLLATLAALLAPLMILLVGALVLVIVLAILLPIFDLNQLVR